MNSEIENKEAKKNNESEASIKFNEIKKEWTRLRGLGFNNDHLSVRESPGKGLGVFANKKIKQGLYNLFDNEFETSILKDRTIVDLDIRESGIKFGKFALTR
jgi:ABC-type oligopeptide transport system substrate-binding subunit